MGTYTPATEKTAIALDCKRDVNLTQPWFTKQSKYEPRAANVVQPLVNGEQAFGAVHDAVAGATKSIDIITWGFDPAMRLRRPGGPRYGDLLLQKAKAGVQVRVLVWSGAVPGLDQAPGNGMFGSGGGSAGIGSGMGSTSARGSSSSSPTTDNAYGTVGSGSAGPHFGDPESDAFNRKWFAEKNQNLAFRKRGFSPSDRATIRDRQLEKRGPGVQTAALTATPSHHQKMLLVDYELPDFAVGFVMGHNSMNEYWDTDQHEYSSDLRLGFGPWQDLSARVYGPILFDLNENFSTAWTKSQPWLSSDLPIPETRKAIKLNAFEAPAAKRGKPEMAQICRTQPQENEQSILDLYKVALSNARNYIYFENQYFRHTELAMHVRETRRQLKCAGWKRDFYIFVVTNVPEATGRMTTYDMLNALGKSDQMPTVKRQESDELGSGDTRALRKSDLEGVNIHVCTLCATGYQYHAPQGAWGSGTGPMGFPSLSVYQPPATTLYKPIYVHSKLMLVDDVFFTLGSANVNVRSMESDSELNIGVPAPEITRQWRQHLWKLHTGRAPEDDPKTEFKFWKDLLAQNSESKDKGTPLAAPLINFYDDASSGIFVNRRPD